MRGSRRLSFTHQAPSSTTSAPAAIRIVTTIRSQATSTDPGSAANQQVSVERFLERTLDRLRRRREALGRAPQ